MLILAGVMLVNLGCGDKEEVEKAPVVRPVKTMVVGANLLGQLTFPGTTQATDRSMLSFRVAGVLVELPVDEGDVLKKGDLVARLDPQDFDIALNEAKAEFDKAEADRQRYQKLYEQEAVPKSDLEMARATRDVAKARYDQARADMSYSYLRAPYDGTVGRKFMENFEKVDAQQPVVTLQNVDIVEVVVDVPEYLMTSVDDLDSRLEAVFDAAPDKVYELTYKEIQSEADPTTRTFRVTLQMPQPDDLTVLPGMTVRVSATLADKPDEEELKTFTLPTTAVYADADGQSRVWVVDAETMAVHSRVVTLGPVTGENSIRVMDGLTAGEVVVTVGAKHLTEDQKVREMAKVRTKGED